MVPVASAGLMHNWHGVLHFVVFSPSMWSHLRPALPVACLVLLGGSAGWPGPPRPLAAPALSFTAVLLANIRSQLQDVLATNANVWRPQLWRWAAAVVQLCATAERLLWVQHVVVMRTSLRSPVSRTQAYTNCKT